MSAKLIDGNKLSEKVLSEVKKEVFALAKKGIVPGLAVVLVGEGPASKLYVSLKNRRAKEAGIYSEQISFPENVSEKELIKKIEELNKNKKIHGILVQLPLPKHIDEKKVIEKILPEKDVDGFTSVNFGKLMQGEEFFVPCTPKGIVKLIESTGTEISGKNCVVVGRSITVGKPVSLMMLNRNATVSICHSKTKNLAEHTKNADILIVAVGKPDLISKSMVKKGAVVIDAGINEVNGKTVGDVSEDVKEVASYITPVPGGVGPMTVACLMENTVLVAKLQNGSGAGK